MNTFELNLKYVKDEVGKALSTSPLMIRTYTKHLLKSEGKYIRAASVLAAAQRADGSIHPDAIKFAASIEILHLATLVHDDVMDNADVRRGVPTLHKEYGRKTAVICGDYLLALAINTANQVQSREAYINYQLPNYMEEIALGELSQHLNNGNYRLKMDDYLKIIEGKTAKLFEASFYAGAVTSQENKEVFDTYKRIGYHVGMIFQMLDDCIDFEETIKIALKPVQSDFEQGVITLPLIHAFDQNPDYIEIAEKGDLSRKEVNQIVKQAEGVRYTKQEAQRYYDIAHKDIMSLDIENEKREELLSILDLAAKK
ncbi:MAG: polyprenyl synthetase family protein [Erysipelothrix sp.]